MTGRGATSSRSWRARPVVAWTVRIVAVVLPIAMAFLLALALSSAWAQPSSFGWSVVRWLSIAVVATITVVGVERVARRLLPVASLMSLSLSFPDRAPSRFRVALRTGTPGQLRRRIDEARRGLRSDTPEQEAQRVLELVAALNAHDRLTRGHGERVRAYAQLIAEEMDLDDDVVDQIRWSALLHDIGKIFVPAEILNKQGSLTADEMDIIRTHPDRGRELTAHLEPWLGEPLRAVWEHHERFDGGGYPAGLAGTEISLGGRIVAVADAFDVMTSVRSYTEPISAADARAELARCSGSQFDPAVVRAFLSVSLGRLNRVAGPLTWVTQLALFPAAALGNALGSAGVITAGLVGAAAAGVGGFASGDAVASIEPSTAPATSAPVATESLVVPDPTAASTTTTSVSVSVPASPVVPTSPGSVDGPTDAEPIPSPTTPAEPTNPTTTVTSTTVPRAAPTTTAPTTTPSTATTSPPTTTSSTTTTVAPPTTAPPTTAVPLLEVTLPPVVTTLVSTPEISIPLVPVTVPSITLPGRLVVDVPIVGDLVDTVVTGTTAPPAGDEETSDEPLVSVEVGDIGIDLLGDGGLLGGGLITITP